MTIGTAKINKETTEFITPNGDEMIVIAKDKYEDLINNTISSDENITDIVASREVLIAVARGDDEFIPWNVSKRLTSGDEHPVRVWRDYRNLKAIELAQKADITAPYLSDIETGKRDAGVSVYIKLAKALNVTIDDLIPAAMLA